jgi:tetratricopeptide (TPR) repeat protein
VAGSLSRIGDIWNTKGDYEKALEYFERAMVINLQYYGESHPNVGWSKLRIGAIYQKKKQYKIAFEQFSISFEILLATFGQDSRNVAKIKRRLGFLQVQMGLIEEGINLINASLNTLIYSGLEKDISLAITYMNLSTGYRLKEDYKEALESIQKAIEIFHENRGELHTDTADAYIEYAQIFLAMNNTKSAKQYFKKAYEIRLNKLGEKHPDSAEAAGFLINN